MDGGTLLISNGKATERHSYLESKRAMIEALKEAFNEVAQLPEDEQRHIVEIIKPAREDPPPFMGRDESAVPCGVGADGYSA